MRQSNRFARQQDQRMNTDLMTENGTLETHSILHKKTTQNNLLSTFQKPKGRGATESKIGIHATQRWRLTDSDTNTQIHINKNRYKKTHTHIHRHRHKQTYSGTGPNPIPPSAVATSGVGTHRVNQVTDKDSVDHIHNPTHTNT